MKKIIFIFLLPFLASCSNVDIEKENMDMFKNLENKKVETKNMIDNKNGILTLDDAIKIAMENNTEIKLKEIEQKIAKIEKKISFGNFLPKISSIYTVSEMDEYLTMSVSDSTIKLGIFGGITLPQIPSTMTTRMVDKDFKNYAITAQLPIFVPATWFLYSARSKGENISQYTEDLTKKMIYLKVIQEYYYILALESEKLVLEKEFDYAKKLEKNAQLALETESILKWEKEQATLLLKQKQNALENNLRDLKLAKMNLLKDLNLSLYIDFKTERPKYIEKKDFKNIELEEAIYKALINSELIKINHNIVAINKDKIKIALSNFLPQIAVGGGIYGTGLSMISPHRILLGTIGGFLSIFNGFKDINEYKKAKLQSEVSYVRREDTIMKTIISVVNIYNDLQKSIEDKELADINYEVAQGRYKQKKLENEIGEISNTEFIKEVSEYEKAINLKEKATYRYEVTLEAFKIVIGDDKDEIK